MILDYSKGSAWRKWDLHIHSPLSFLNNQYPKDSSGTPDWKAFLGRLEALDLAVIGITDYFTIDGYKKVREFKASRRLSNINTILPNIEFRLDSVISSKKDGANPRRLNLHVIFSDEVSPDDIEEHFLHDLRFCYEGNPQDKDETRKLKVSNIAALGTRLIEEHKPFRDSRKSAREIGAMTTVVSHEEITEILSGDSRFKGKYLVIFPDELFSLIDWDGQDHHVRKSILQKSDFVSSSNLNTRSWCLGKDPYVGGPAAYIKEFKTLKACIHGSDAHRIEQISVPCALRGQSGHDCGVDPSVCELRYTWIKADPTFEGLRQLLYEPDERVRVQSKDPTPVKSIHCLDRIEVTETPINEELALAGTSLEINHALTAVTGGKGSGKTALVDLIANCYMDRGNSDDPNSFVRRILPDAPNLEVGIRFRDGTNFKKSINERKVRDTSEVVYIAQGELERYIGDTSDLETYIRELVFQSPPVKNSAKVFHFEGLAFEVGELRSQLLEKHSAIEQLEAATATEVVEAAELEVRRAEAEMKDIDVRLGDLEARLSPEKLRITTDKQQAIGNLQSRKEQLLTLRGLVTDAIQFVDNELPRFRQSIGHINTLAKALQLQSALSPLDYADRPNLDELNRAVDEMLTRAVAEIESLGKEIRQLENEMQEHARHLNRKRELDRQGEQARARLQEVEEGAQKLQQSWRDRRDLFGKLVRTIVLQKEKYAEIIGHFASEKTEVLSDLDFVAQLRFDRTGLLFTAEEILDNRQVEVMGSEKASSVFETLGALYERVVAGEVLKIDGLVQETDRLAEALKAKLKKSHAISPGVLYRCLYDKYLTVTPIVTYKKTRLEKLSLGQKATVLMKIYLAQGSNPIIIDSHDDHLDNEFIMDELVGAIRQAKGYRQVILVSNNGNVVINSDAEQIIIANREKGRISYRSGSIENPAIRDSAVKVLEGGDIAFKRRQQKYRL